MPLSCASAAPHAANAPIRTSGFVGTRNKGFPSMLYSSLMCGSGAIRPGSVRGHGHQVGERPDDGLRPDLVALRGRMQSVAHHVRRDIAVLVEELGADIEIMPAVAVVE